MKVSCGSTRFRAAFSGRVCFGFGNWADFVVFQFLRSLGFGDVGVPVESLETVVASLVG